MKPTQRCPHCNSPKVAAGVCFACARSVEEQPDLPRLEGLEDTALETGKRRSKKSAKEDEKKRCMSCGVMNPGGRALCLACGERL